MSAQRGVLALLRHFIETYPGRTFVVVGLLSIAGLAEGFSVLALLPLLQIAVGGDGSQGGMISDVIARMLSFVGLTPSVGSLLLVIVIGISAKAAVTLLAMKEAGFAVGRLMTDLRRRLIAALMEARWSYFVTRPLGIFANAIGAEAIRAGVTYQQSTRFVAAFIQALVYGVATFLVSWKVEAFAVFAGLIGVFAFRKVVAVALASGERQTDLMKSLSARTTDTLQGIKPIKAMAAEKSALPLLDREIRELDETQRSQVWSAEILRVTQEPLLVVFLAIAIYGAVAIGGETLPALMVIAALFYRLFNRFQVMQEIWHQIGIGASAYWSILRLCEETEREGEQKRAVRSIQGSVPEIALASVSFDYPDKQVLRDVSLRIGPGEFVAISGPSGGGKTTLLDIVSGLLLPSAGRVLIGGDDLRQLDLRSWRSRIGYVPQELLLLHDSVYQNICLADTTISRAQAEEALRAAGVWDVVASLPDGLDAMVGERGSRFSGGQRQRISLARALVRKPSILLLDEITASLDKETARAVCATLRQLAGKMTIIAVSHQSVMTEAADRVIRLDHGVLTAA